ncbi:hypothetical protein K2P47_03985 [Patescibacteria group bacterium]|nr:hypothetical protein [Patescibacteria group bacterium]
MEVHFEAVYDKWRQHDCPPGHQNEVVVKRASFTADVTQSLEANCVAEGERVFAAAPGGVTGYNHLMRITAVWMDGVRMEPAQLVRVPVKIKQAA